jgi:hypothetical protein
LVGFIYPVYASIKVSSSTETMPFISLTLSMKAIETATKVDDQFWLTYWIIFGTFKVMGTCNE